MQHNKSTPDSHTVVISIFSPSKHKINSFEGYDTEKIGNRFRWLTVLKNTLGDEHISVPILIDNIHLEIEYLPNPFTHSQQLYQQLLKHKIDIPKLNIAKYSGGS